MVRHDEIVSNRLTRIVITVNSATPHGSVLTDDIACHNGSTEVIVKDSSPIAGPHVFGDSIADDGRRREPQMNPATVPSNSIVLDQG